MPKMFLSTLFALLAPFSLQAAPFCVQMQGIAPMCDYYDAGACQKRAAELKGICSANPEEITLSQGVARFCVVDSSRVAECHYFDRTSCIQEADRRKASCLEMPDDLGNRDPYQQQPSRNY